MRRVAATWWPLAASWLLMSLEGPALSGVVARLPDPTIHLAAYGGIVFQLALIIESPIIMLLAASTALSKDQASYEKLERFMWISSAILTAVHALIAFTPLFYPLVAGLMGVPEEVVEPARLGLKIMLPWSASIAYRRFNQGALIRFGRSRAVGVGTAVRLTTNLTVLTSGYLLATGPLHGQLPGVAVGAGAIAAGVISEAIYAGIAVRPVRRFDLPSAPPVEPPLTWAAFYAFYFPLVMMQLLTLIANPIGSAAISRMPQALESLAAWGTVTGLVFILRSPGVAYNEVVVALLDRPGAYTTLRRFSNLLKLVSTAAIALIAFTPLSSFYFNRVMGLAPDLATLGRTGFVLALPLPWLTVLQSWYQGAILHGRATRGITESVVIYLLVSALTLGTGIAWGGTAGLYIGVAALTMSTAGQTLWLWQRARPVLEKLKRDELASETR